MAVKKKTSIRQAVSLREPVEFFFSVIRKRSNMMDRPG